VTLYIGTASRSASRGSFLAESEEKEEGAVGGHDSMADAH
jgi:hypothetical protein